MMLQRAIDLIELFVIQFKIAAKPVDESFGRDLNQFFAYAKTLPT